MRFYQIRRLDRFFLCWLGLTSVSAHALSQNRINHVDLTRQADGVVVEIAGEQAPNFTTFKQDSPRRVIVDVAECQLNGVPALIQGKGGLVKGITVRQIGKAPDSVVRVMIALSAEAEYRVTIRNGSLLVHIMPGTGGLLVSAGVPVGPDDPAALLYMSAHDRALEKELSGPSLIPAIAGDQKVGQPSQSITASQESNPINEVEQGRVRVERTDSTKSVQVAMALPDKTVQRESSPPAVDPGSQQPSQTAPKLVAVSGSEGEAQQEDSTSEQMQDDAEAIETVEDPAVAPEESEVQDDLSSGNSDTLAPSSLEIPSQAEVAPVQNAVEVRAEVEERVELSTALRHMTWVGFQQTRESSRVFVKTNAPATYRVSEEGQNLVVLELDNTVIPLRNNRRFLDTHFFDSAVAMIVPREVGGVGQSVRIEIQLKQRVPFRAGREENMVFVNFERSR